MIERVPFDLKAYVRGSETKPCFICGLVNNDPACFHHRIFEDDETIIFLSKYPTLPGYCLVSPREHREDLARDISTDELSSIAGEGSHPVACPQKGVRRRANLCAFTRQSASQ